MVDEAFRFRPEPDAESRAQAPCPASTLLGRRFTHPFRHESVEARGPVESGKACVAVVSHRGDAGHREARLRNGGGEDHAAAPCSAARILCRADHALLFLQTHRAVQGEDLGAALEETGQAAADPRYFPRAGEEAEEVALGLLDEHGKPVGELVLCSLGSRKRAIFRAHGMGAAGAMQGGRGGTSAGRKKACNRVRVECGRHHEESQIGACLLRFQREAQAEIGVDRALVELVEDHQADAPVEQPERTFGAVEVRNQVVILERRRH